MVATGFTTFTAVLSATIFLSLSGTSLADNRTCYYPDHSEAVSDVPCGNGTNVACCSSGSICLTTGLCMAIDQQPYALARQSCTDSTWGPDCPNYCLQEASFNSTWVSIVLYTFLDNVSNYCCNNIVDINGNVACLNGLNTFTMPNADFVPNTNVLAGYVKANTSSTSTTNTTSTCNATSTDSGVSSNSTNTSNMTVNGNNSSNHDAAIGAGVGVPLGVIALAAIAWALWERRKLHQVSAAHAAAVAATAPSDAQKQEYMNNSSPPPPSSQYTPPPASQYNAYPNGTDASMNTYQQPLVRSGQNGYSEMASTGPVELDGGRRV